MPDTTASPARRLMPEEANRLLLHKVPVPPLAHAYHHWDDPTRTLTYTYNGRRLIEIHIPGEGRVSFRHGSDGTLQGVPFVQQIYVMLTGPRVQATVRFRLGRDAVNLRPARAGREQPVLGQLGRPLLPGANGLYDLDEDLLITFFGQPWNWVSQRLEPDEDGNLGAELQVELGPKTWIINVKPHYYRVHLGYRYHRPWQRRPDARPVAGWCSWEAHRREVTEADVLAAANFLRPLRPYGLEYIQVDDGFERLPFPAEPERTLAENWLATKPEFPSGHAGLAAQLRERGFVPGVWLTACAPGDAWAAANRDALLHDAHGAPLIGDWTRYVLDCSPATLARHVRPAFRGFREAGYGYVKIDGIRHLLYDGLHEAVLQGLMTNDEAEARFRRYMEAARQELGPDTYFLASWGVLTQCAGAVDACRIAQDASPHWRGIQMQIVESARWYFMHRVLWTNDPDHVCARAPLEWTRTVLSLVSLSGGLYMLSDAIEHYDPPRLRLFQQTLPPLGSRTAETGPLDTSYAAFAWTKLHGFEFGRNAHAAEDHSRAESEAREMAGRWPTLDADHPLSSLWAWHLDTEAGSWCVAGRFAVLPLRASTLALERLALDPQRDYLVFDFWAQRFLGRARGTLAVPALPLGHCQVLALRTSLDRPQLLSSSRHVSQDAVSVRGQAWSDDTLTLSLEGVRDTCEVYWLHVPPGWTILGAEAGGQNVRVGSSQPAANAEQAAGAAVPIEVKFAGGTDELVSADVRLRFARLAP